MSKAEQIINDSFGEIFKKIDRIFENITDKLMDFSLKLLKKEENARKYKSTQKYNVARRLPNKTGFEYGNNARWIGWIENGSKEKRPKKAKALRWVKNGKVIFAKYAKAIPPKPFIKEQLPAIQSELERLLHQLNRVKL
jgi:NADPH-dependent curcumin reductase CurA